MKNVILTILLFLGYTMHMSAQVEPRTTVKDYIDAYGGTNAKPYLQPLVDLVTTNIHTGVWDWAGIPDQFYFRIKANGMLSIPTEDMRKFQASTTGDFQPAQTITAPTIIGNEATIILQGNNNDIYVFPGGYNMDEVALATPQVTMGGFLNTEVSGRFLSFRLNDDQGKVNFYGIGVRHALSNYLSNPALDVSVGYFYHRIDAGDYLNTDQHLISLMLGKSGKVLSAHLSGSYQTAMHHLSYTFQDDEDIYDVHLDMQNSNPWIMEAGLGAKLGPLFVNGAVSYADFITFALGAGLTF